ncbi:MAG: Trk system potassium transporter TrkA [Sphingobacteriales bacterium]|nr:Trk system potassium transporter TrkA [Sphingobacteriales bacterium]
MNIVISGAGAVGLYLAKMLVENDHNVTLIDKNEERLRIASAHLDILTYCGSSSLISVQKEANIPDCDLLIAVTNEQDANFLTCILGKKSGAKTTIARINNLEYLEKSEQEMYQSFGVDTMIFPELIAANEIVALIRQSAATEIVSFCNDKLILMQLRIEEDAEVKGKTLREIIEKDPTIDYRAVAIQRNNKTIMPSGKDVFIPGDEVFVVTKKEKIDKLLKISGSKNFHIRNIMLIGASEVGILAARELEQDYHVKLIEKRADICQKLAGELKHTLIINADGHELNTLKDEGLEEMDAFISVTENTEANIFFCLLAKRNGAKKTIALIEDTEFIEISHDIGVDTIINKKLIAASHIHRYTLEAEVVASKCLNSVEADVFEFIVKKGSRITSKKVSELNFPENAILGGYIRNGESYIVKGDTQLQEGDHVVVFSVPSVIHKVEQFFSI